MSRLEAIERFWKAEMPPLGGTGIWVSAEEMALMRVGLRDMRELLERIEYLEGVIRKLQAHE